MRLAQPVLRRMLRMWLAAVCSLIDSSAPISRLLRPRATSSRICASRGESPSGSAAARCGRAERLGSGPSRRAHADPLGQRRRLAEQRRARSRPSPSALACSRRPYS